MKPRVESALGLDVEGAWALILGARWRAMPAPAPEPGEGAVVGLARDRSGGGLLRAGAVPPGVRDLLDLYLPLCSAPANRPYAVGHLGQSLDGRIATAAGASRSVTGPENIMHLHRMRALADAVVVGAETVRRDDPQLTTRLVAGPSPVRVVLDPHRRLDGARYRVFDDGAAETLVVCDETLVDGATEGAGARLLGVPSRDGQLDLSALRARLLARGLRVIFVEGGGVTVSRFLAQGALERLQVAVAPVLLGAGRPGLSLPPVARLEDAPRPPTRVFRMGGDVLFDCDLGRGATGRPAVESDRGG